MRRANYMTAVSRRSQRGVGLIEVLIALLVLSFGMLGLAGLQMWSLRYNQSAMERGMAVVQTHSIADAMRAHRTAAMGNQFDIEFDDDAPEGNDFTAVSLRVWLESLRNLGPEGDGEIDCDGSECTIRVRWNDSRASGEVEADGEEGEEGEEGEGEDARMQTVTTVVQL